MCRWCAREADTGPDSCRSVQSATTVSALHLVAAQLNYEPMSSPRAPLDFAPFRHVEWPGQTRLELGLGKADLAPVGASMLHTIDDGAQTSQSPWLEVMTLHRRRLMTFIEPRNDAAGFMRELGFALLFTITTPEQLSWRWSSVSDAQSDARTVAFTNSWGTDLRNWTRTRWTLDGLEHGAWVLRWAGAWVAVSTGPVDSPVLGMGNGVSSQGLPLLARGHGSEWAETAATAADSNSDYWWPWTRDHDIFLQSIEAHLQE